MNLAYRMVSFSMPISMLKIAKTAKNRTKAKEIAVQITMSLEPTSAVDGFTTACSSLSALKREISPS